MDVRKINELFGKDLKVINMGLDSFAENLRKEEVEVLAMDWKPPAGGNKRLISLLEKLERQQDAEEDPAHRLLKNAQVQGTRNPEE